MLNLKPYRDLFADHELRRIILSSILPRLPLGMNALGLILLVQAQTGSFTLAGQVSAAYLCALAAQSPIIGRLIDLYSPKRLLLPLGILQGLFLLLLVYAVVNHAPHTLVLIASLLAGLFFPPISVIIRSMWRKAQVVDSVRQTAFALESVIVEIVFVIGPMLVGLAIAIASAAWAVVASALMLILGTWHFARSGALTRWGMVEINNERHWLGPLTISGVRRALLLSLLVSFGLGLNEMALPGYATQIGKPSAVAWFYATLSIPSGITGLIYGSRSFSWSLNRQIMLGNLWLMIGSLLMAGAVLTGAITPFALAGLLCGLGFGPLLTALTLQLGKLTPSQYSTEAFTWGTMLFMVGLSAGFSIGGWFIEQFSTFATLLTAAFIMALAALIALFVPTTHLESAAQPI